MRNCSIRSIFLLLLAIAGSGAASAEAWVVPPPGWVFAPSIPCDLDPARAAKPARPNQAVYAVCDDQMALFRRGLDEARAGGRLLLVTFGATWCPWCASLQRHFAGPDLLRAGGDGDPSRAFHHIDLGLSHVYEGQKETITSGEAVLGLILSRTPSVRMRSIPFLAVVDPASSERVFARNLDDVATKGGDFDVARLRSVLIEAHAAVRR